MEQVKVLAMSMIQAGMDKPWCCNSCMLIGNLVHNCELRQVLTKGILPDVGANSIGLQPCLTPQVIGDCLEEVQYRGWAFRPSGPGDLPA